MQASTCTYVHTHTQDPRGFWQPGDSGIPRDLGIPWKHGVNGTTVYPCTRIACNYIPPPWLPKHMSLYNIIQNIVSTVQYLLSLSHCPVNWELKDLLQTDPALQQRLLQWEWKMTAILEGTFACLHKSERRKKQRQQERKGVERERTYNTTPHGKQQGATSMCLLYVQYRAIHTHVCMYVCTCTCVSIMLYMKYVHLHTRS